MGMDGFEADDLIGTLADKAAEAGMETTIVSGDKDFMQLVSPKVRLVNPQKGGEAVEIDADGVRARFGDRKRREVKRATKISVAGYGGGV